VRRTGFRFQVSGFRPAPSIRLILLASLLLGCRKTSETSASSTNLVATATLSANVIHVGDLVTLRVDVAHPDGCEVQMPELGRGREIVVRDQRRLPQPDKRASGDSFVYSLTSLSVSNHVVSTNVIRCVRADGSALEQPFPFLTLQVESLLTGTNSQMRDIKGLVDWPNPWRKRLLVALAAMAAIAAIAGLIAYALPRRRRAAARPTPPPPPHEMARRALEALARKGYIEAGNAEPFYVDLSGIVRTYIELRFGLRAPELTTEEFIREATGSRLLSLDHQQLTMAFLEQCDLVKFARHRPMPDDMRAAFAAAERLVNETALVPSHQSPTPPNAASP
jgi:hypothetical protein